MCLKKKRKKIYVDQDKIEKYILKIEIPLFHNGKNNFIFFLE